MLRIELVFLLIENCPRFKKVRFIENWEANTEDEINNFWRYIETNNIDLDAGEKESYEVGVSWIMKQKHNNYAFFREQNEGQKALKNLRELNILSFEFCTIY